MVFAAGFGKRLQPLFPEIPKPLVSVGGKPLIDHALSVAEEFGICRCIVNLHHCAEALESHLSSRDRVVVVHEADRILDTGGGLLNALPLLDSNPAFTLNSDTVWHGPNPFRQLAEAWNPERMDALLLLSPSERILGHAGTGDFVSDLNMKLRRCSSGEPGLVYTGAQIIKTDSLSRFGMRTFSLNVVWDDMIRQGRLFGTEFEGKLADAGNVRGYRQAMELAGQTCP